MLFLPGGILLIAVMRSSESWFKIFVACCPKKPCVDKRLCSLPWDFAIWFCFFLFTLYEFFPLLRSNASSVRFLSNWRNYKPFSCSWVDFKQVCSLILRQVLCDSPNFSNPVESSSPLTVTRSNASICIKKGTRCLSKALFYWSSQRCLMTNWSFFF